VQRAWRIGWATLRDLGRGCGGVLLLLPLLALWLSQSAVESTDEVAGLRRKLELRTLQLAVLTTLATLIAAAWSVAEDRRARRLAHWLVTPLRLGEYLAGKLLGCVAGCVFLGVLVQALTLALLVSERSDLFRPVPRLQAQRILLQRGDRLGEVSGDRLALRAGDQLQLQFSAVPNHPAGAQLALQLAGLALEAGPAMQGPQWAVLKTGETPVWQSLVDSVAEIEEPQILALPASEGQPLTVGLRAGSQFDGRLLFLPDRAVLVGAPRSLLLAHFRVALGLAVVIALAATLGVTLATVLPDVLAVAAGATVLGVGLARDLLADVAHSVAHAAVHEGHVHGPGQSEGSPLGAVARGAAQLAEALLAWIPDLQALLGGRLLASAGEPFSAADPAGWLAWGALSAITAILGWLALGVFRRWY
jgi:hypothetical protein